MERLGGIEEEAAAGVVVHGEISGGRGELSAHLPN